MSSFKFKGHFWIENHNGEVIGPGKERLLEETEKTGSIKSAAKGMKMSYRHTWKMADTKNWNNSKQKVEKVAGGFKGSATQLSKERKK